ncbi:EF-hand domain-containing protein [Flagellimonas algicola]|uniref:EF-hand domain-containing protein n=1 Tax=Flagellimonas algicola TaxID=2583815 RepID=A0ABY2WH46_9FLAO|nr:EF-hand domain-containing protein [Allomuricauda algicola]TMU50895.1 EF-hand domain-containing protein [Allomuricauda algicola]
MNKTKTTIGILVFAIAALYSSQLAAQEGDRKGPPSFEKLLEKMDANEDGKLSENEVKGPLKKDFAKVDLNEDGFISEEEFDKAPKPQRRKKSQ